MKEKIYRFFAGRYGHDQLNYFLLITGLILYIFTLFLNNIFTLILYNILLWFSIYRSFSRKIYDRRKENEKFMEYYRPLKQRVKAIKMNFGNKQSKHVVCPVCHQICRVPKGRGKITVTCPKCRASFDARS